MSSKRRYRELFENAVDVLYTHDLRGNFRAINKAVERTCGYSRREVLRKTIFGLLDAESGERMREAIRALLGGRPRCELQVCAVRPEGRKVALEVGCRLLFRGGRPVGVQGVARDVTERNLAQILESDRNRVLELVAGSEPLETVLESICRLAERQTPGAHCGAVVWEDGRLRLGAASKLPAGFTDAFAAEAGAAAAAEWSELAVRGGTVYLERTSAAPLAVQRALASNAGLAGCSVTPILSRDASPLAAFVVFREWGSGEFSAESPVLETARRLAVVAIENRRMNDRLIHQALHDALTGLPNRLFFEERLARAVEEARRHNWLLAVLFIDLDRFKQINDTLGHSTGDLVLRQAAGRLAEAVRKNDCLARLGGDEFGLLLTELNDGNDARRVAQKLLAALSPPFQVASGEFFLSASIGISLHPRDGQDAATLQSNADAAMYLAKARGAGRVEFFTAELGAAAAERLEVEAALRRAVERGELELYYQPQTGAGHKPVAVEALMVWNHPKLGKNPPSRFIPVAEECGLIVPIGVWALHEACRRNAGWRRAGLPPVKVAVNVSPLQFSRTDLAETVAQALADTGLDPALLELELTEGAVFREPEESISQMRRLKSLGVGLVLDDFGTGYSSLSHLRLLPIDALKIDRSFVMEVEREPGAIPLLSAILALAHGLGLEVVAEGIETQQQFETLRRIGCDRFQGYLLGQPAPAAEIERLLSAAAML
ncbi:MAG: EAL domain-containing protein [Bryobacterales bacterium]|nr:EAL domain-containing protein [Bryobacterales bacterium]